MHWRQVSVNQLLACYTQTDQNFTELPVVTIMQSVTYFWTATKIQLSFTTVINNYMANGRIYHVGATQVTVK